MRTLPNEIYVVTEQGPDEPYNWTLGSEEEAKALVDLREKHWYDMVNGPNQVPRRLFTIRKYLRDWQYERDLHDQSGRLVGSRDGEEGTSVPSSTEP